MIKDINAITPEYLKYRIEQETNQYKQEIERLKEDNKYLNKVNIELSTEKNRLNNVIDELEKDIENKIAFCSNEANGSINNKLCKISIQYLEHLKNRLQELKGSNSDENI